MELAEAFVALRVHSEQVAKDVDKGLRAGAASGSRKAGEEAGATWGAGFKAKAGPAFKTAVDGLAKAGGIALVGLGAASLKMAANFQEGLTTLVTGAGESERNLKLVGSGIKGIAAATGTSTAQLISGMYQIESAGYHGAAGLSVLRAAAEGAKVGNADLGAVANAVTTVMTDYALKGPGAATKATDALIATTARGKTHLQDLATSMARVLPTAAALHISMGQVGGAMATMTGEGTSARLAAMGLNATILAMAAPTHGAAKEMGSLGLSSHALSETLTKRGLVAALDLVAKAARRAGPEGSPAYVAAMKTMLGGTNGLRVALQLTGTHMSTLVANTRAVSEAMDKGKGHVTGWELVQKDFNVQMDILRSRAEVAGITLGQVLLPVASKLLALFAGHAKDVLLFIGAILGIAVAAKIVMGALKLWEGAQLVWAAVTSTSLVETMALWIMYTLGVESAGVATAIATGGIIIILAALGIAAFELYKHWGTVWAFIKAIALDTWHWADDLLHNRVFNIILGLVAPLLFLALHWRTTFAEAKKITTDAWHWAQDLIHSKIFGIILASVVPLAFLALHWRTTWADAKRIGNDFYNWLWSDFGAKIATFFTRTVPGWLGALARDILNLFTVTIPGYFSTAVTDVGRAWGAVQHAVATPVNWVIQHVINGLIGAFDWISSKVGGPSISKLAPLPGFAAGGRVTAGSGPTSDDVLARVSRNETIVSAAHSAMLAPYFSAVGVPGYAGGGVPNPHGAPTTSGHGGIPNPLGLIGSIFGKGLDVIKIMAAIASGNTTALANAILSLMGGGGAGGAVADMATLLLDIPKALISDAVRFLIGNFRSATAPGVGGGVRQWTGAVLEALAMLGLPAGYLGFVLNQMSSESGGNTTAVNRSDINWIEGHPSVGLMQVIAGTFAAWAGPFRNVGPFLYGVSTNPLANIYAALNYGKHGRGFGTGPGQIGSMHGYLTGGRIPEDVLGVGSSGRRYLFHGGESVTPAGGPAPVDTGLEGHLEALAGLLDTLPETLAASLAAAVESGGSARLAGHRSYYGVTS